MCQKVLKKMYEKEFIGKKILKQFGLRKQGEERKIIKPKEN